MFSLNSRGSLTNCSLNDILDRWPFHRTNKISGFTDSVIATTEPQNTKNVICFQNWQACVWRKKCSLRKAAKFPIKSMLCGHACVAGCHHFGGQLWLSVLSLNEPKKKPLNSFFCTKSWASGKWHFSQQHKNRWKACRKPKEAFASAPRKNTCSFWKTVFQKLQHGVCVDNGDCWFTESVKCDDCFLSPNA